MNLAILETARKCLLLAPDRRLRNRLRVALCAVRHHLPPEILIEPGDVVVQIGTPNPQTLRRLHSCCGRHGAVVVIEAVRENYERLKSSVDELAGLGLANFTVVHKAVFSSSGLMQMRVSSSFRGDHALTGLGTLMDNDDRPGADFARSEPVEADTIDNILADVNRREPDVMIITVNGAEFEALRGASRTLSSMDLDSRLFVKAHARKPGGGTICDDISEMLVAAGYRTRTTRRFRSVSSSPDWRFREGDVFAYKNGRAG